MYGTYAGDTCIFALALWGDVAAHGEAWLAVLLVTLDIIAPRHRHVVYNPVMHVVLMDTILKEF